MGLLDPSKDDQQHEKKPRFLQDSIAFIIIIAGGVGALIYVLLTSK